MYDMLFSLKKTLTHVSVGFLYFTGFPNIVTMKFATFASNDAKLLTTDLYFLREKAAIFKIAVLHEDMFLLYILFKIAMKVFTLSLTIFTVFF